MEATKLTLSTSGLYDYLEEETEMNTTVTLNQYCVNTIEGITVGGCATAGVLEQMQDEVLFSSFVVNDTPIPFFGVFDGHGYFGLEYAKEVSKIIGAKTAAAVKSFADLEQPQPSSLEKLLEKQFLDCNAEVKQRLTCGSILRVGGTTAILAFVFKQTLYVVNVGDCRAVLADKGVAKALSVDDKVDAEHMQKEFLEKNIPMITCNEQLCIGNERCGRLAVGRVFGDYNINGARPTPTVATFPLSELGSVHSSNFLILASDGIWDVIKNEAAVNIVEIALMNGKNPSEASEELVEAALKNGSEDNCSAIVIKLVQ